MKGNRLGLFSKYILSLSELYFIYYSDFQKYRPIAFEILIGETLQTYLVCVHLLVEMQKCVHCAFTGRSCVYL